MAQISKSISTHKKFELGSLTHASTQKSHLFTSSSSQKLKNLLGGHSDSSKNIKFSSVGLGKSTKQPSFQSGHLAKFGIGSTTSNQKGFEYNMHKLRTFTAGNTNAWSQNKLRGIIGDRFSRNAEMADVTEVYVDPTADITATKAELKSKTRSELEYDPKFQAELAKDELIGRQRLALEKEKLSAATAQKIQEYEYKSKSDELKASQLATLKQQQALFTAYSKAKTPEDRARLMNMYKSMTGRSITPEEKNAVVRTIATISRGLGAAASGFAKTSDIEKRLTPRSYTEGISSLTYKPSGTGVRDILTPMQPGLQGQDKLRFLLGNNNMGLGRNFDETYAIKQYSQQFQQTTPTPMQPTLSIPPEQASSYTPQSSKPVQAGYIMSPYTPRPVRYSRGPYRKSIPAAYQTSQ